jgi:hypothetical protein
MNSLATLAALIAIALSSGDRSCLRYSAELYDIASLQSVSDSLLVRSEFLVEKIDRACRQRQLYVPHGDSLVEVGSSALLFGQVCERSIPPRGVDAFITYRLEQFNSSDEDYSLALERVFAKDPETVLRRIHGLPSAQRTALLNDIVWGFLNNRLYGVSNPLLKKNSTPTAAMPLPAEVLNVYTYERIFFQLHPDLRSLSRLYQAEVDFILHQVKSYFLTWGGQ